MRLQKIIGMAIICLAVSTLAIAQPQGAPEGMPEGMQGGAPGGAPGGEGGAPGGGANSSDLDMTPVYEAMDANKDGKIGKEEWLASGMDQISYDNLFTQMLDNDKDGFLTKEDIMGAIPRFEVDFDGDGKASIEEFAKANADAAASMGLGGEGGAPGGAPGGGEGGPGGGAPGGAPEGAPQQ